MCLEVDDTNSFIYVMWVWMVCVHPSSFSYMAGVLSAIIPKTSSLSPFTLGYDITLFRSITMLYENDNVPRNVSHI